MKSKNPTYNIPERFLKQLWTNQQFSALKLKTTDNQPVQIISTGQSNSDAGPDYMNSVLRINGVMYRGDVEIHQRSNDWLTHGHHKDPKYNSVILHVVFSADPEISSTLTKSKRRIPILSLEKQLNSTLRSIWGKMILDERSERLRTLKCYEKNIDVEESLIRKFLNKLSIERMELKVRRFEERIKELINEDRFQIKEPPPNYGDVPFGLNPDELPSPAQKYSAGDYRNIKYWDQMLYEGVMEALGYSKNQESFLRLARNVRLKFINDIFINSCPEHHEVIIQSILIGAADLLPVPKKDMDLESKNYIRLLRTIRKKYNLNIKNKSLRSSDWQFFRLRPDNFPTVRIAAAARLLNTIIQKGLFKPVIQTIKNNETDEKDKYRIIQTMFVVCADRFWKTHYRFGEIAGKEIMTLIGKNRADDIMLNAVVPVLMLYARIFKDKDVRHGAIKLLELSPASAGNTITKTIDQQIVRGKLKLDSAMLQQGAIQLYKFYCMEGRCGDCLIGNCIQNLN
ncbi:MAG: DUF2851 family protein [Ignavibacteriales bacterium]|nr:DUF2851 family protein [Ignavibacteriales bacterium]